MSKFEWKEPTNQNVEKLAIDQNVEIQLQNVKFFKKNCNLNEKNSISQNVEILMKIVESIKMLNFVDKVEIPIDRLKMMKFGC